MGIASASNNDRTSNATGGGGEITISFLHPRDGKRFGASVGPDLTGRASLDALIAEGFIAPETPGHAYTLTNDRTRQTIPVTSTLRDAGVKDGDLIAVNQMNEGHAEPAP